MSCAALGCGRGVRPLGANAGELCHTHWKKLPPELRDLTKRGALRRAVTYLGRKDGYLADVPTLAQKGRVTLGEAAGGSEYV